MTGDLNSLPKSQGECADPESQVLATSATVAISTVSWRALTVQRSLFSSSKSLLGASAQLGRCPRQQMAQQMNLILSHIWRWKSFP